MLTYSFKKYEYIEETFHEISDSSADSDVKFESRFGPVISKHESQQDLGRGHKLKLGAS